MTASNVLWQRRQKELGNCIQCGLPKEPDRAHRTRCAVCSRKQADHSLARHRRLVKRGLCGYCGKPREHSRRRRTHCEACSAKDRARYHRKKEERACAVSTSN